MKVEIKLVTTQQAADALGIKQRRVRALIADGRLDATKIGSEWLIAEADLSDPKVTQRKNGRPFKNRPTVSPEAPEVAAK